MSATQTPAFFQRRGGLLCSEMGRIGKNRNFGPVYSLAVTTYEPYEEDNMKKLIVCGTEGTIRAALARPAAHASGLGRRLWGG